MNARLSSVGLVLAALLAGPAAAEEASYLSLLVLPSPTDVIGHPRAVTADPHTGEVFVCDSRRHRIYIFDSQGIFLHQIPGGEVFRMPLDVAADPDGYLLLLARHGSGSDRGSEHGGIGLLWLDFDGRFVESVTLSGLGEGTVAPNVTSIALSPSGDRIYALDQANQRLWIAGRDGAVQASATLDDDVEERRIREHLLGRVDVSGDTVLVARASSGDVRLYGLDGDPRGWVGIHGTAPCQTAFPVAAAMGEDGNVVILDQQRMLFMVWDPRTNRCKTEHSGIGNAPGFVYQPSDLALDVSGRVYVSQGFEGRVQAFQGFSPAPRQD